MSAEAAVLCTPYIRYNDFVGKIGYLKELEEKYQLGYGIKPDNEAELIQRALKLAKCKSVKTEYQDKRMKMLSEKINTADYLYTEIIHTVVRGK
jgi:predicted glycosyltransferase